MPFRSKAQQRFMFATQPDIARRWADHTPDFKALPEKVRKHKTKRKAKPATKAAEALPELLGTGETRDTVNKLLPGREPTKQPRTQPRTQPVSTHRYITREELLAYGKDPKRQNLLQALTRATAKYAHSPLQHLINTLKLTSSDGQYASQTQQAPATTPVSTLPALSPAAQLRLFRKAAFLRGTLRLQYEELAQRYKAAFVQAQGSFTGNPQQAQQYMQSLMQPKAPVPQAGHSLVSPQQLSAGTQDTPKVGGPGSTQSPATNPINMYGPLNQQGRIGGGAFGDKITEGGNLKLAGQQLTEGEPVYNYQLDPDWTGTSPKGTGRQKQAFRAGKALMKAISKPLWAGGKALSTGARTGAEGLGKGLAAAPGAIGRGAKGLGRGIAATPRTVARHPVASAAGLGAGAGGIAAGAELWRRHSGAYQAGFDRHDDPNTPLGQRLRQYAPNAVHNPPVTGTDSTAPIMGAIYDTNARPDRLLRQVYGGKDSWRPRMVAAAREQGMRGDYYAPDSYRMLNDATRQSGLPSTFAVSEPGGWYDPMTREIIVGQAPADPDNWVHWLGEGGVLRHEFEHARQHPHGDWLWQPKTYHPDWTESDYKDLRVGADELPAVLGDVAHIAEQFRHQTGRPLQFDVAWPSRSQTSAEWIARQARQHGFPQRSMTELLGTEPGQRWLRQRLEVPPGEEGYYGQADSPLPINPYRPLSRRLAELLKSRDLTPQQREELLRLAIEKKSSDNLYPATYNPELHRYLQQLEQQYDFAKGYTAEQMAKLKSLLGWSDEAPDPDEWDVFEALIDQEGAQAFNEPTTPAKINL